MRLTPWLFSVPMTAKYYTHFVMNEPSYHGCREFCGVVELDSAGDDKFENTDIVAMLASNFQIETDDIRLLQWSRLH